MGRPRVYTDGAARSRAWRARQRAERAGAAPDRAPLGTDARAVAEWAAAKLRVPAGHGRAGRPFVLEDWQCRIIDDVLTHRETLICMARKNAKSALIAVLALAHLVGPLRCPGWRCGVLSASRIKAGELLDQCVEIAEASSIEVASGRQSKANAELTLRRTPWPGKLISNETGGRVEIEGAGYASGHASGYDLAVIDELGLLGERHRRMVNGMRSAGGAKGGRFVALSIHGAGPFIPEILKRKGSPSLAIHHYHGDRRKPLDDPANWAAANPGLGTIKDRQTLADAAERVLQSPADQADFLAHELNLPGSPAGELITSVESWRQCETMQLPARTGRVFVGIDLGSNKSFCSAAFYWPKTGRLEVLTACPADRPKLAKRAEEDAAGDVYQRAHAAGTLLVMSGILTPVGPFLAAVRKHLAGEPVGAVGADGHRHNELVHHASDQGLTAPPWRRPVARGNGVRAVEDASGDIRAFQNAVDGGTLRTPPNELMLYAIGQSTVVRDGNGKAIKLLQARARARIDCLQAAVIAVGLGHAAMLRRQKRSGHIAVA